MTVQDLNIKAVKEAVVVEDVIAFLGLNVKFVNVQKKDNAGNVIGHEATWRGTCPLCQSSQREFVITVSKKLYRCFRCRKYGSLLDLTMAVKKLDVRSAALELAAACGVQAKPAPAPAPDFDPQRYLESLLPEHEALEPLNIPPEIIRQFKGGYKASGKKEYRGRLMMAMESEKGIDGFMGLAIGDEEPQIVFPPELKPELYIFGAYNLVPDRLVYICRSPMDALQESVYEPNCIAFLTETVSTDQWHFFFRFLEARGLALTKIV